MEYSLIERGIENELIDTAKELGVKVLAFGTVGHGLLTERVFDSGSDSRLSRGPLASEFRDENLVMLRAFKDIADKKGVSMSQLALAWSLAKYDNVQSLIGTTNPEHLQESVDALRIELSETDINAIESAVPADKIGGKGMRNFVFTDGQMALAK